MRKASVFVVNGVVIVGMGYFACKGEPSPEDLTAESFALDFQANAIQVYQSSATSTAVSSARTVAGEHLAMVWGSSKS